MSDPNLMRVGGCCPLYPGLLYRGLRGVGWGGRARSLGLLLEHQPLCPGTNLLLLLQGKPGVPGLKGEKVSLQLGCPRLGWE